MKKQTPAAAPAEKKKKPGPHARQKAREAAAATPPPLMEKAPKPDKPPRVLPYVDRPFSEENMVPLSDHDWKRKAEVMMGVRREETQLIADRKAMNETYKKNIADKQAEIVELETELLSRQEKKQVALVARFYPAKGLKVVLMAHGMKKVREEPMTPQEKREVSASQPALLAVPAGVAPTPAPVASAAPKDGDMPADKDRTNPKDISGVTVDLPLEGFADSKTVFGAPRLGDAPEDMLGDFDDRDFHDAVSEGVNP